MKIFISVLFLIKCCSSFGQTGNSFELTGSINRMSGNIKLFNVGPTSFLNKLFSTDYPVKSGKFLLKGKINCPIEVYIRFDGVDSFTYVSGNFFIEPGDQIIYCNADSLREIPHLHNGTMFEYRTNYRSIKYQELDTIEDYYKRGSLKRVYLYEYAQRYPDSYVALWEISRYLKDGYSKYLDSAFNVLTDHLKASDEGKMIKSDLDQLALTDIDRIFPKIRVIDLEGKTRQLAYVNMPKYVLIDFWFSHCRPCLQQMPEYVQILSQFKEKGFAIIGISSDSSASDIEAWKNVIKVNSLSWTQYRASPETMRDLRITLAPYNFLLDREGKIVAKDLGTKEVLDFLKERLN